MPLVIVVGQNRRSTGHSADVANAAIEQSVALGGEAVTRLHSMRLWERLDEESITHTSRIDKYGEPWHTFRGDRGSDEAWQPWIVHLRPPATRDEILLAVGIHPIAEHLCDRSISIRDIGGTYPPKILRKKRVIVVGRRWIP